MVLLAMFHFVIEDGKCAPGPRLGLARTNAITIYLISNVTDFATLRSVRRRRRGAWLDARWTGLGGLVLAMMSVLLCMAVGRFLYQRKVFLRL